MSLRDFIENEFIPAENQAWEQGDFRGLDRVLDPNIVIHPHPPLSDLVGLEAVRQYVLASRLAIPNFRQRWQYLTGDGDVFALLRRISGIFPGQVPGKPAGKESTMEAIFVFRLKAGKVVEEWIRGGVTGSS